MFMEQIMTESLIARDNIRNINKVQRVAEGLHSLEPDYFKVNEIASNARHTSITSEQVARKFNIGIDRAKETLKVTMQKVIRHAVHPLHRRYRVNHMQLNRKRLNAKFYAEHLVARTKSLDRNTGVWVYTTGKFTASTLQPSVWRQATSCVNSQTMSEYLIDCGKTKHQRSWVRTQSSNPKLKGCIQT